MKEEMALEESIRHWEENARAETVKDVKISSDDCALCLLFRSKEQDCAGCPVSAFSGKPFCLNTPYINAYYTNRQWEDEPKSDKRKKNFHAAAQKEVEFLKSLRKGA